MSKDLDGINSSLSAYVVGAFEEMNLVLILLVAAWASAVGPESPSVHVLANGRKSLVHFGEPLPLSMQDVLPSIFNSSTIEVAVSWC